MAWKQEHKIESRQKILHSAAMLFTANGYDNVSIDAVMSDAGLTRGAFYAHFKSKVDLYANAILMGAERARERIAAQETQSDLSSLAENYLHIGKEGAILEYCPLAFLVTDICHREPEVRDTYAKVFKGFCNVVSSRGLDEKEAMQASILLIGGLALSRAVNDQALSEELLETSLEAVRAMSS